ncbi:MAG: DUF952 domain-containing protein [Hyphomicrobiaceae bacterium]
MRENTQAGTVSGIAAPRHVYKVLRPLEWAALQRDGRFAGSPDDIRDGFVHLSCWTQVQGTLERHFSRPEDREVAVAAIPVAAIEDCLRWEKSRGGGLFPHLYRALQSPDVARSFHLARGEDGRYTLPAEEPA